jgi:hypothetical protein
MRAISRAVQSITRSIDIFGSQGSLYVDGNVSYRTVTGGFFSLLFVLLLLAISYQAFAPIYYKLNPTFTYTLDFIENPGQLNVTTPNFYFSVAISINGTFADLS